MVAERNLIYLYPTPLHGNRPAPRATPSLASPLAAATAFALYLVTTTPYALAQYPNYEAHGLAIAAFANRILRWGDETIETTLVLITLVSGSRAWWRFDSCARLGSGRRGRAWSPRSSSAGA